METKYAKLVGKLNKFGEHLLPAAEEYSDELTTLSQAAAAITALEAALKPFADRADKWALNSDSARVSVKLGDLRHARDALSSIEPKP